MVFASYNSASYLLPLDNDQSVSFYRNENRLFPTAIGPSAGGVVAPPPGRNNSTTSANDMSITDMLTAAYHHEMQQQHQTVSGSGGGGGGGGVGGVGGVGGGASGGNMNGGDCPFGRVQSPPSAQHQQQQQLSVQQYHRFGGTVAMCDDFQPVGYFNGSSNGYYGFVPSLSPTGGGGSDAGGHSSNNNVLPGAVNNSRPPATTANVNGHLSAIDFHGNQHHHHRISCNADAGEQNNNNNNNNNGDDEAIFHVQPFAVQQMPRKRKELNQPEDEEMDTNAQLTTVGQQYPKRRKTDPEPVVVVVDGGMNFPVSTNGTFAGNNNALGGVSSYQQQHQVEVHNPAGDEMECQDQPAQQHPAVTLQPDANGFHAVDVHHPAGQQPTSKSKYFDTSRCMMSHMI